MLKFSSIMIGSAQPEALAKFYERLFDRKSDWTAETWHGWQVGYIHFVIGEHSGVKGQAKEPGRLILNFETEDIHEDFQRIKNLGAEVVMEPYDMKGYWIATFADPDGNYFQLMSVPQVPLEESEQRKSGAVNGS